MHVFIFCDGKQMKLYYNQITHPVKCYNILPFISIYAKAFISVCTRLYVLCKSKPLLLVEFNHIGTNIIQNEASPIEVNAFLFLFK